MISDLFEKRVINQYNAVDYSRNDYMFYRRLDFTNWAKEAFDRGEEYFYCKPVNPDDPTGEYELCEPEYRWFIKDRKGLTEEQFNLITEDEHTNILQEIFNPTPKQLQKQIAQHKRIHYDLAVDRSCVTCKHCIHVRNYPGFVTGEECECDAGLECDTILGSVTNCEKWEDGWND